MYMCNNTSIQQPVSVSHLIIWKQTLHTLPYDVISTFPYAQGWTITLWTGKGRGVFSLKNLTQPPPQMFITQGPPPKVSEYLTYIFLFCRQFCLHAWSLPPSNQNKKSPNQIMSTFIIYSSNFVFVSIVSSLLKLLS